MKNFINQLQGKEQYAVYAIKKLIAAQLNPLLIYCFGCKIVTHTSITAFNRKQRLEERRFTCDLLIITPENTVIDEEKRTEIQEMLAHFGTVNMIIHPLYFVLRKMNEDNLFFNWVHKNGMLLYDRNNSSQLLPAPVGGEIRQQAEQFYNEDPGMNNYLEVKLQPISRPEAKKESKPVAIPVEINVTMNGRQV